MSLHSLFGGINKSKPKVLAVVDLQWGDTGKGKFVDYLAEKADIIARGTGGANAGHTIILDGRTHVFHLIPSGILWDKEGKVNVIGRGVAVDPRTLAAEIQELKAVEHSYDNLRVSCLARLVLPIDIALDRLREAGKDNKIGTTGRGIGPVYESYIARTGLTVNDLLNKDVFAEKLKLNYEARAVFFKDFDPEVVKVLMHHEALENGAFWCPDKIFDLDAIVDRYLRHARWFRDSISDTDLLMQKSVGKKRVLLEGAQGVLLSVAYGSYPYVTSSDCSLEGLAHGVGLRTEHVDYSLGIVKAPYMTRVGKGAFPTEFGGAESESWCNGGGTKDDEREKYPSASMNSLDPLEQGVAIRQTGLEYGATTGRLRRVGWLDLPLLRYASKYGSCARNGNRPTVALTKVDVFNQCESIKLCTGYRYEGPDYRIGSKVLQCGNVLHTALTDSFVLDHCTPEYEAFPGWQTSLEGAKHWHDVPEALRLIITVIETQAGVKVDAISVGPSRDEIVM